MCRCISTAGVSRRRQRAVVQAQRRFAECRLSGNRFSAARRYSEHAVRSQERYSLGNTGTCVRSFFSISHYCRPFRIYFVSFRTTVGFIINYLFSHPFLRVFLHVRVKVLCVSLCISCYSCMNLLRIHSIITGSEKIIFLAHIPELASLQLYVQYRTRIANVVDLSSA